MSRLSHLTPRAVLRRGALGGLGALVLLAAASSPASAAKLTLTYQCSYPLIGEQPLAMELSGDFPSSVIQGVPNAPVDLEARFTGAGNADALSLLGAKTIEGSAVLTMRAAWPDASLPYTVGAAIESTPLVPGAFNFTARGATPMMTYPRIGTASVSVDQLRLRLLFRRADGTVIPMPPGWPGVDLDSDSPAATVVCRLDPPLQDSTLATFNVSGDDFSPSVPANPRVLSRTATSAELDWEPSNWGWGDPGLVRYEVFSVETTPGGPPVVGERLATSPYSGAELTGLTPDTRYSVVVRATAPGGASAYTAPLTFTTTPGTGVKTYGYGVSGAAILKTLTKGTVPLTGSLPDMTVNDATGAMTATLSLDPVRANLITLGFLPISAQLAFTSSAPTTGQLKEGVLTTNSKVRIKFSHVSLMGLQLFAGSNCQTRTVSNLAMKSTGGAFDPITGGSLAGTFAMSDLTGCGSLNGLVSSLTAGKGNAIAMKLTPQP